MSHLQNLLYHTPEGSYCVITCPKHYEFEGNTCRKSEVCRSKRIVNRVSNLRSLSGCRVIEGSLQIVLIEGATEEDWKNWSFPELVEITEFLLVYRVRGLRSLGQLFPNLSVIRGSVRHQGYALIVYGVNDLEVIGLYSLTRILQGSVRIQNNFHLCYVHTVDWSLITGPGAESVFKNNNEYLYPLCDESCPERNNLRRCWDSTHCQRVCPAECQGECTESNECCHKFCAGGCSRPNKAEDCHACKDYSQGHTCVRTCGKGYYKYGGYRCVTMGVCVKKLHGILLHKSGDGMDECVDQGECPAKYFKTEEDYLGVKHPTCKKCEAPGENCAKNCSELLVNTIAKAQQLVGCTKIEGRLIISITGGKAIAKELNASLGKIEIVTDYIRVFSSNALRSLNFLKSLRVIGGNTLYNDKYALYVHGNDNLEEIWTWDDHKNFTITEKKASVLFHSNPKLCYKKIKELLERTNRVEMTADCNMNLTNGNKAACMDKTLELYLTPLALKGTVNVSWNTVFINDDDRMLTGYYIFYKVALEENVTYLDGRDACHDDWSRKYVENKVSDGFITQIIEDLEPATKYAIYVQTDTVVDAAIGARSNISYTMTLPFNPSKPPNVKVTDKTDRSMTVMWTTPLSPNGEINQYIVTVKQLPYLDDSAPASCSHDENVMRTPILPIGETTRAMEAPSTEFPRTKWQVGGPAGGGAAGGVAGAECCACPESRREERQMEIDFEDELYGLVYKRRSSSSRQRRSINETGDSDGHNQLIQLLNSSELNPAVYQDLIDYTNSSPVAKEHPNVPGDCIRGRLALL
ncbi:insulin-like growth factor 1 receptor isoform X1 [Penaeus japonicus]|uniref:insulin-like growth factor 1 receptor isoform X1 n=1 Tax=Penaeus japonicus TaxID=27405 RepID=UPI001C716DBD|nr:insulin-like growth factor 1 receptor isoform X1 [Penaeus japonicus]